MGRIIYETAATLNGWIADERHSLDWLFAVEGGDAAQALVPRPAVYVEGSTTYEWVVRHESLLERPARWRELFEDRPTYVFTTRSLPTPEGADVRFVSGPVAHSLPEIRAAAGDGDIWIVGGGELAAQFLDAGALDDIVVTVAPVMLERGAPLFPRRLESERLRLRSTQTIGQFVRLAYEVRGPRAA